MNRGNIRGLQAQDQCGSRPLYGRGADFFGVRLDADRRQGVPRDLMTTDEPLEAFADLTDPEPPRGRSVLTAVVVLGLFAIALGGIPWLIGFGPFGYRLLTGDEIAVHVLNLSGGDLEVELSFAATVTIEGGRMETLTTLSGGATLTARTPDGEVRDTVTFDEDQPVFYFAGSPDQCFAVFDITDFYNGEPEEGDLKFVRAMTAGTNFHAFEADTIVLPRRVAPDQARGVVHWLEDVSCDLLAEGNEPYLIARTFIRMQQRREAHEERQRAAREATTP